MTTHHDPDLRAAVGLLAGEDEPVGDLLPGALAHGRRARRRHRALTAAASVVVLLAGTLVGVAVLDRGGSTGIGPAATTATTATTTTGPDAPAGYRWVSAYGVELVVPATWTQTGPTCQPATDTVFVGERVDALCPASPSPPPSDWVGVLVAEPGYEPTGRAITVDGQPGIERAMPDQTVRLYLSPAALPGRELIVIIKTGDPDTYAAIRDSVRLPTVDHAGCPTTAPLGTSGVDQHVSAVAFTQVQAASACVYDVATHVLLGSRPVDRAQLPRLLEELRRAPSVTGLVDCAPPKPSGSEAWVRLLHHDGRTTDVVTTLCGPGYLSGAPSIAGGFMPVLQERLKNVTAAPPIDPHQP